MSMLDVDGDCDAKWQKMSNDANPLKLTYSLSYDAKICKLKSIINTKL